MGFFPCFPSALCSLPLALEKEKEIFPPFLAVLVGAAGESKWKWLAAGGGGFLRPIQFHLFSILSLSLPTYLE